MASSSPSMPCLLDLRDLSVALEALLSLGRLGAPSNVAASPPRGWRRSSKLINSCDQQSLRRDVMSKMGQHAARFHINSGKRITLCVYVHTCMV